MPIKLGTINKKIPYSKAYLGNKEVYSSGLRLRNLPVGAKVMDENSTFNGVPVVWIVGEHDHYGEGQTVLISEKVLQFMPFDGKEASGGATQRNAVGNSNYSVSNIDQWLNSDDDASAWFTAKHTYDQAPNSDNVYQERNEYDNKPGFLNGFSTKFKEALIYANVPYKTPPNEGSTIITVSRKVFLPSAEEIGASVNGEGSIIEYFNGGIAGAYPTEQAVANADSFYQYGNYVTVSKMSYYWLRTSYNNYTAYVQNYDVSAPTPQTVAGSTNTGTLPFNGSCQGVRPLVNIDSSIIISEAANEDGIYIIQNDTTEESTGGIPEGTIALYHLENDISNAINGEVVSTPASSNFYDGKFGKCYGTVTARNKVSLGSITSSLPSLTELSNGATLTIECWFRTTTQITSSTNRNYRSIITFNSSGTMGVIWYHNVYTLIFNNNLLNITDADNPYNNWVHIALVAKDGKFTLFINGKNKGSVTIPTATATSGYPQIGTITGQFDEILISTEALYAEDFTPPTAPYEVEV